MTPWDVVEAAARVAARLGPEVVRAWSAIHQGLRAELPELDRRPLPAEDEAADASREAGIDRQAEAAERRLRELGRTDTDPLGVDPVDEDDTM